MAVGYRLPAGGLPSAAKALLVPENIRAGVHIKGGGVDVVGTLLPTGCKDTGLSGSKSAGAKSTAALSYSVDVTGYNAVLFDCAVSSNGNGGKGYVTAGTQKVQGCAGYGGRYSGKLFVLLKGQSGSITLSVVSSNDSSEGSVTTTLRNIYLYNIPGIV